MYPLTPAGAGQTLSRESSQVALVFNPRRRGADLKGRYTKLRASL